MNLGNTIKQLRQSRNIKQNELAELCGITQSYLSLIESNSKEPHLSLLNTIADKLQMPLPMLFFLSMESEDIRPERRAAFQLVEPALKALVNGFFNIESTTDEIG